MSYGNLVREGMSVYGADNKLIGTISNVRAGGFEVAGQFYPTTAVMDVSGDRVMVDAAGHGGMAADERMQRHTTEPLATDERTTRARDEDVIRVPLAEEELKVGKRETDLGEVQIHKQVVEEQVSVPVELQREEVRFETVDIDDRRVTDAEAADAFKEGTIRVPVHGEEAVVNKTTHVTGEVVVEKDQVVEQQQVSDTVRRTRVKVDEGLHDASGDETSTH